MRSLSFAGRAGIREFWLVHGGIFVAAFLTKATIASGAPWLAVGLLAISGYVGAAVSVRRLHDRDKSGWWLPLSFVPIVGWVWWLIALGLSTGARGANRYGPPEP